jgi:5-formyltetrahydrofolate cyclo-ligase
MTKSEIRKTYLVRNRQISAAERIAASEAIARNLFFALDLASVSALHCFIPIEKFNEVDTTPIFHRIWLEFPQIVTAVPRVDFEADEMKSHRYTAKTELMENEWQILEPLHEKFLQAQDFDIVLVPGLAFDRAGHRVGYGKGFYDKFLVQCRADCIKVGLSYFPPVPAISDAWSGDIKLDLCITPEQTFGANSFSADGEY